MGVLPTCFWKEFIWHQNLVLHLSKHVLVAIPNSVMSFHINQTRCQRSWNKYISRRQEDREATQLWERTATEDEVFLIMFNCQKLKKKKPSTCLSSWNELSLLTCINGLHLWSNQWEFNEVHQSHCFAWTYHSVPLASDPLITLAKHFTRSCFLLHPWFML